MPPVALTAEVSGRVDELLAFNTERRRQRLHKQQLKWNYIHKRSVKCVRYKAFSL